MRYFSVIVLGLVLIGLASACGGDDDSPDAQPTQAGAAQATQAPAAQASATRPAAGATAAATSPISGVLPTIASGTGAAAIEACRLFTKDEAATALGEQVKDPQGINIGSQTVAPGLTVSISSCTFDSNSGSRSADVTFWRAAGTLAPQIRQAYEQVICGQNERVSGLGDLACWYDSTHTELMVLRGATFIDLQLVGVGPDRADALKTLTQRALSRLQ